MSDQDTMTREQLEAAGYVIHEFVYSVVVELGENNCFFAPTNGNKQAAIDACLQAATSHYRQQQELARLREAMLLLVGLRNKCADRDNELCMVHSTPRVSVDDIDNILRAATVSKIEHAE